MASKAPSVETNYARVAFIALFGLDLNVEFLGVSACTAGFSVQIESILVVQLQREILIFLP